MSSSPGSNAVYLYNNSGTLLQTFTNTDGTAIQDAIAVAQSGDTIQIAGGTYDENVNVNVSGLTIENVAGQQVTIVGQGGYTGALTIASGVFGVTIKSSDGVPSNFVVEGSPNPNVGQVAALYLVGDNDDIKVNGITTISAAAQDSGLNSVLTGGKLNNILFENNVFEGDAEQLVYVNGAEDLGPSWQNGNVNFVGNTFAGSATGGLLGMSAPGEIINNKFTGSGSIAVGLNESGVNVSGNTFTSLPTQTYFVGDGSYDPQTIENNNTFPQQDEIYIIQNGVRQDGVYSSIQAAIDAAINGDTIIAGPGVYTGHIIVDKSVTIEGANFGVSGTGTRGAETDITGEIDVTADNVTINGVQVTGSYDSVQLNGTDLPNGVWVQSNNVTIENSIFTGDGAAVDSRPFSTEGGITGFSFSNNSVTGWQEGAYIVNGGTGSITDDTFTNDGNGVVTESVGMVISNDSFVHSGTPAYGIGSDIATDGNQSNVDLGTFIGPKDTFSAGDTTQLSVYLNAAGPVTVTNDTGINATIHGEYAQGSVTYNGGTANDTIIGSSFNDTFNLGSGSNSVTGGGGIDTVAVGAGFRIAIENNQWVVTNGTVTDTLSGIDKVDINGTTYDLVDQFGSVGGFQSVQAAVNAASAGDTILIAPGTYTGATISEALTIQGWGAGTTFIDSGANANGFDLIGNFGSNSTVSISNIGFTGSQDGIDVHSSTELTNLNVNDDDFKDNTISGVGMGSGAPDLANISITNSTFEQNGNGSENGDGDISLFGFLGNATLENLVINGGTNTVPTTSNADYGIQIAGFDPNSHNVTQPIGNVVFNNVQVNGAYDKVSVYVQGYTDLNGLSFQNTGKGGTVIDGDDGWGIGLYLDPTAGMTPSATIPPNGNDLFLTTGAPPDNINLNNVSVTNGFASAGSPVDTAINGTPENDTISGLTGGNNLVNGDGGIDTLSVGAGYTISISNGHWVVSNGTTTDTLSGVDDVVINGKTYELVDKLGANGGFQSLQAAIDNASTGATILVAPGTYTESANFDETTGKNDLLNGSNPIGLLVDQGVTIEGVDGSGNVITSAANAQATIVSSYQAGFGTNFMVDAANVAISGLIFQATDSGTGVVNKAIEDNANNFTLENSVVDAASGIPIASSVYIDDWGATTDPNFVSSISQFDITGNILDGDLVEASGVGAGISLKDLSLQITNNQFSLNQDTPLSAYIAQLGRANLGIILNGDLSPTIGWDLAPVADPTITGNTIEAGYTSSPTGALLRAKDDSAGNLPSLSYIQNYVANNSVGTYAYDLKSGGSALDIQSSGGISSYYVYIDAGDASASGAATAGDLMIVQSGSDSSVQTISTNNLTIEALAGSTALDLALDSGVTEITLGDYSIGKGAHVTVVGNNSGDTITGHDGNDTLTGGTGNDLFNLGTGNNTVTGDGGLDTAHLASTLTEADFSFSNNEWVVTNGASTDDLSGISVVTDGAGDTFLLVGGGSQYSTISQASSSPQFVTGDIVVAPPPVVTPTGPAVTATVQEVFNASTLFSATSSNGSTIQSYEIEDESVGSSNGFWTLNGLVEPNGSVFTVTAAQLSGLTFTAGSNTSLITDTLKVAAADAAGLGSFATFTVSAPGHVLTPAPTVTASNESQLPETVLAASSMFSGTAFGGNFITSYEVEDTTSNSGSWIFNGVTEPANQVIDVSAAQISELSFQTGFGTDTLMVRANDGTQWGNYATFTIAPKANAAPPGGTTTVMDLEETGIGIYEYYDIGKSGISQAGPLAQISTSLGVVGIGGFDGSDTADLLARNSSTGAFTIYDVSNNNVTGSASMGQVGTEWQVAGFGDFSGTSGETDMIMHDTNTGQFEVYDIRNNAVTGAAALGQVGSEWQVAGFGDFSTRAGESDMLLRDSNTGQFEVYDISHNQLVSAAPMGQVGLEWQVLGFGDFSGNANETDMLMRNENTGAFEVYDIRNNQIVSAASMGQVGLEWTLAGFADFSGNANETDMLLRDSASGAFELYDISGNTVTAAMSIGSVGTEWQVAGVAADPPPGSSGAAASTVLSDPTGDPAGGASISQLTQAMASIAAPGGTSAATSPLGQSPMPSADILATTTQNNPPA